MTDQCQSCGSEVNEWDLDEAGMCKDCAEEYLLYSDPDEIDETEDEDAEKADIALNCRCGAWGMKAGKPAHYADCVCGAQ